MKISFFGKSSAWIITVGIVVNLMACSTTRTRSEANGKFSKDESPQAKAPVEASVIGGSADIHFSMAQAYVTEGNPDRAIEEFKLALMYDSKSALIHARLATEYVKKGMLSEALDHCKQAIALDPKFIDVRLMLAGLYANSHETQLALDQYDFILKTDPRNEEAIVYRAQTLIENNNPEAGVKTLRGFVKKYPDSAVAWYYLGRFEQAQEHSAAAAQAYKKALSVKAGFPQAAMALGYLYEEQGNAAQAIATYQALYDESQDLAAANRLVTIFLKGEKYEKAIPYLQSIEALDPDDLNAQVKLGLVYMELKKYDQSIQIFKRLLEKNPDSDRIHYYLGSLYEERKEIALAIDHLNRIKADSKLYSDAVMHVAYLYRQSNQLEQSKEFMRGKIAETPRVSSFYLMLASLEEESKNLPRAAAALKQGVSFFPEDEKLRYYLGSMYDRMGDSELGLEQMEAILKINPDHVDALNYMGYTWTQRGIRLGDAEKLLKRALALRPDNGYVQDSWGWYLFVRGRTQEAVVELEKAARLKPNEPTILEHLGDAYLKSNLREKAFQRYQDAVRLAEDDSFRRKLESKITGLQSEFAQGGARSVPDSVTRKPASAH